MYMYKKFLSTLFILIVMLTCMAATAAENGEILVTVNDQPVNFTGQTPVIVGGRTLVPVADVFRQMGFSVTWDEVSGRAVLINRVYTIVITVGSSTFVANRTPLRLDMPAQIINGTMMLPIRAVVESIGYYVNWHDATNTVQISSTPFAEEVRERVFVPFSQQDPRWRDLPFGSFTMAGGGCGPTAMAMVVSTLHGVDVLPCYVATWGRRFYVSGAGSAHALFTHNASHRHFGLSFRTIPAYREQEVLEALRGGAVIVTSVQAQNSPNARAGNQGLFMVNPDGAGGHFALLHGVTDSGNVLMATPRRGDVIYNLSGWPLRTVRQEMHRGVNEFWVFTLDEGAAVSFGRCHS